MPISNSGGSTTPIEISNSGSSSSSNSSTKLGAPVIEKSIDPRGLKIKQLDAHGDTVSVYKNNSLNDTIYPLIINKDSNTTITSSKSLDFLGRNETKSLVVNTTNGKVLPTNIFEHPNVNMSYNKSTSTQATITLSSPTPNPSITLYSKNAAQLDKPYIELNGNILNVHVSENQGVVSFEIRVNGTTEVYKILTD